MKSQLRRQSHHHFQLSTASKKLRILPPDSHCLNNHDGDNLRKNYRDKVCQLGLLLLTSFELMWWEQAVSAQIEPDNTLGEESSIVTPQALRDLIEGGAIRNTNLFHSFTEFNVNEGQQVDFANPQGIVNILTRVTGANPSDIFGTLGVDGTANLILLNPNGINFGANANLDVAGSFLATTAESVVFNNGFEFSATNPEAPPLITINIPIGLQYGQNPGAITNQSVVPGEDGNPVGLQVQPGKTLGLIGGDVEFLGGVARSTDARIEIGAVGSNSLVSLTPTDRGYALGYEGVRAFADITFNQSASVETSGEGGGSIQLQGRNITLSDGSSVFANTLGGQNGGNLLINSEQLLIENGSRVGALTFGAGDGGNVIVNATDSVQVVDISADGQIASSLSARAVEGSTGNAGDLTINTKQLLIQDGAVVDTATLGAGDGGDLVVNATDSVQVIGIATNGQFSFLIPDARFSFLTTSAGEVSTGDGGDLTINTRQLLIQDGAQLVTATAGTGDAGDLVVNATDSVQVIGIAADRQSPSVLSSGAFIGNAGDLTINTRQLLIQDGAEVNTVTLGEGDAGNLTINTEQLLIQDGAHLITATAGAGDGGDLVINAIDSVQVIGIGVANGQLRPSTLSSGALIGNAGDLTINTRQLLIQDGGGVNTITLGDGNAGDLVVNAMDSVQVVGIAADGQSPSTLSSGALIGNAGDLTINTRQLLIQDGGGVNTVTLGEGDAGNLTINATDSVQIIGTSADGQFNSILVTGTGEDSIEDAGDLTINTRQLLIKDGAEGIGSITLGAGNGGNLTIKATDSVQILDGGTLSAQSNTESTAGNLSITTNQLVAQDNATISVSSFFGQAGNLEITANNIFLNQSQIIAEATLSDEVEVANISLEIADLLLLENESFISASTNEQANGGNVTINGGLLVAFPPTGDSGSDIQANAFQGDGGRVNITAEGIFGIEFRDNVTPANDITVTSVEGSAGIVELDTPDTNPAEGLNDLPETPTNPQPVKGCQATGEQGDTTLVDKGRGGSPSNPYESLSSSALWEDIQPPTLSESSAEEASISPQQVVEAQGWIVNDKGNVELVAELGDDSTQTGCGL